MGGQYHAPATLSPQEGDLVPIVQEAGCTTRLAWKGVEVLFLGAFEPLAVQPMACSYTKYGIPAYILKLWYP